MKRWFLLAMAAGVIASGLFLRLIHLGLPLWVTHTGGGFLWGAMVYLIVAALRPYHWTLNACLLTTSILVMAVELSRLCHTPSLDLFRTTLAGQLLLGRLFSLQNVLVYETGAAIAAILTRRAVSFEIGYR